MAFDAQATTADPRVVRIAVVDRDVMDDDAVGQWEVTLGELLRHEAPWQERLLGRDGVLRAGGILSLSISVESR